MPRVCAYVCNNTSKVSSVRTYGNIKGQKQPHNFSGRSNLKYKFWQRNFWCCSYYVDTVGKNEKRIAEYVRNQIKEDMMYDQITIKEYKDPFRG